MSQFDLTGRRAFVTGSGQGIGLALAQALVGAGASVVLNGRDAAKLDRAAAALRAAGVHADTMAFDVTDAGAVAAGVARIESESAPSTSWSTTPASSAAPRCRTFRTTFGMS